MNAHYRTVILVLLFPLLTVAAAAIMAQTQTYPSRFDVWTRSYDAQRTATNWQETILTPRNVNQQQFSRLFTRNVDGHVFSQVLYLRDLPVQVKGLTSGKMRWELRNVIFAATMRNVVYAFDADNPSMTEPLWMLDLGHPAAIADGIFGEKCAKEYNQGEYRDIFGWVGIVSTPVIDRRRHAMFLVSLHTLEGHSKATPRLQHYLYHIDIRNGIIVKRSKVSPSVKGNGNGNVNGRISLNTVTQLQRSSLALSPDGKHIYFGFGAYCDTMPYHGWVVMIDTETLEEKNVWCSSPNAAGASVWNSGEAIAVYPSGKILVSTANTPYNPTDNTYEPFSISDHTYPIGVMRIDPHKVDAGTGLMTVDTYFIPEDDMEVGLMGTTIHKLNDGTEVTTIGGKWGKLWVVDINEDRSMPGMHGDPIDMIQFNKHLHGTPVHWRDESDRDHLYIWPMYEPIKHYIFEDGTHKLQLQNEQTRNSSFPGGFLSMSGKRDDDSTIVLWANVPRDMYDMDQSAIHNIVPGALIAYDPTDVTRVLWSSDNDPNDQVGEYCKFNRPVVTGGKVYLPALSNAPFMDGYIHTFGLDAPQLVELPMAYDPEKKPSSVEAIEDLLDETESREENKWIRLYALVSGKAPLSCSWHGINLVEGESDSSSVVISTDCMAELELTPVRQALRIDPKSSTQQVRLWVVVSNNVDSLDSEPLEVDMADLPAPPSMIIQENSSGPGGNDGNTGDKVPPSQSTAMTRSSQSSTLVFVLFLTVFKYLS